MPSGQSTSPTPPGDNTSPTPGPSASSGSRDDLGRVASLVADLDELTAAPLAEHADGYQRVHAGLHEVLAAIDER